MKDNKTVVTTKLDRKEDKEFLQLLADKKKWKLSQYIREIINNHLKKVRK